MSGLTMTSKKNDVDITVVADHVVDRKFTDWIAKNITAPWGLHEKIPNKYPFDIRDQNNTSFADFYIFRRLGE